MKVKTLRNSILIILTLFLSVTIATADDFDWTRDLNIRAQADPSGYSAQLSTRFKIGNAQVKVVLGNVDRPSDAYMVFRLGEMSSRSTDYVLSKYSAGKSKGWGALAKNLGIKPGSKEFHALKNGGDLYAHNLNSHKKDKSKGKGKKG